MKIHLRRKERIQDRAFSVRYEPSGADSERQKTGTLKASDMARAFGKEINFPGPVLGGRTCFQVLS